MKLSPSEKWAYIVSGFVVFMALVGYIVDSWSRIRWNLYGKYKAHKIAKKLRGFNEVDN